MSFNIGPIEVRAAVETKVETIFGMFCFVPSVVPVPTEQLR